MVVGVMYVRYCALAYCGGGDLFFFLPLRVLPVCEDGSQICDDGIVRSGASIWHPDARKGWSRDIGIVPLSQATGYHYKGLKYRATAGNKPFRIGGRAITGVGHGLL